MKKHNRLIIAFCVCFVAFSSPAKAALIKQELVDVSILGNIYDVTFLQDDRGADFNSYNDIMPGITFTTVSDATSAVNAIIAAAGPGYDYTPGNFDSINSFRVTFGVSEFNYDYMTGSEGRGVLGPFDQLRDSGNSSSFAAFELAGNIPTVPEPGFLALLSLGLLGFAARKVKRKI